MMYGAEDGAIMIVGSGTCCALTPGPARASSARRRGALAAGSVLGSAPGRRNGDGAARPMPFFMHGA